MLCHECKEQIEVGEACQTEYHIGTHMHYFHTGCYTSHKEREATQGLGGRLLELQQAAKYAGHVC